MMYVISFLCGVVLTVIAEIVAVYYYGRRAAKRKR